MKFEYLDTERLRLRKLTVEVYKHVFKHYTDQEIETFFNHQSDEDFEKEKLRATKGLRTFNKDLIIFHLIDKSSNQTIGTCGFHNWYLDHDRAELGYFMTDDNFKRKGLMTEALKRVVDYGFKEMKLNRIEAFIAPYNEPSIKLVSGMCFIKEGLLRSHYFSNGQHEDSVIYGLLRKDYYKE